MARRAELSAIVRGLPKASLVLLGVAAAAFLYLDVLVPRYSWHRARDTYLAASALCGQSIFDAETVGRLESELDEDVGRRIAASAEVSKLPCKELAILREELLAKGVSPHLLSARYQEAVSDTDFLGLAGQVVHRIDLDAQLTTVTELFGLAPLSLKEYRRDSKFDLGEALFYDTELGLSRERSCSSCHDLASALSDSRAVETRLPIQSDRLASSIPARNVPDLWNRDNNDASSMLWDGRVGIESFLDHTMVAPEGFETTNFENLMAVQSVRPLVVPEEMLGNPTVEMTLRTDSDGMTLLDLNKVFEDVALRLLGASAESADSRQSAYRRLFLDAYQIDDASGLTPAHIGNAIAHFAEIEFQTRETPWDLYLGGQKDAISDEAKLGAILFYGIGRCGVCHSGPLLSDFSFHSIGVPDPATEKDLGRYYATGNTLDMFKFRTPPLRNVTLTAPYFHNGYSASLEDVLRQHLKPLRNAREYSPGGEHLMTQAEISAVSPILRVRSPIAESQIQLLLDFLESLEDEKASKLQGKGS